MNRTRNIVRVQLYRPAYGRLVEITCDGVAIVRAYGGAESCFADVIRAARIKYRQVIRRYQAKGQS